MDTLRNMLIDRIKEKIDWHNSSFSWHESFVPMKYPDFDKMDDKTLLDTFENVTPQGPVA